LKTHAIPKGIVVDCNIYFVFLFRVEIGSSKINIGYDWDKGRVKERREEG
jgi:hypothetical protein